MLIWLITLTPLTFLLHAWLASLLLGSTRWNPLYHYPFSQHAIISPTTIDWLKDIHSKYDLPGISLGAIASPLYTSSEWKNQTFHLGHLENGELIDDESLFAIASNSKLLVAVSLGLLIEDGTKLADGTPLDYGTKIKAILPDWKLMDDYASSHVSLLDLLSMQSGLPRHDFAFSNNDVNEIIHSMRYLKPMAELRQTNQYCNFHYTVLSHIVTVLSGMPHTRFIQQRIFDPLNLTATFDHVAAGESGKRVPSHLRQGVDPVKCQKIWNETNTMDVSCIGEPVTVSWFMKGTDDSIAGVTGGFMSITDGVKWIRELLDPNIIPRHVIEETHKPVKPSTMSPELDLMGSSFYGQAQVIYHYRGFEVILHGGVVPGITTQILRVPSLGVGVMLAIEDTDFSIALLQVLVNRILEDIMHLEPTNWEEIMVTRLFKEGPEKGPAVSSPRPAPASDAVAGRYHDPAYGTMDIKRVPASTQIIRGSDSTISDELAGVIRSALDSSRVEQIDTSREMYYAASPRFFTQGVIFTHFDGPLFNISVIMIQDRMDNGTPISRILGKGTAVFVEGQGVGMFEGSWQGNEVIRVVEEDVASHAEVWFNRVN